jgi:outer membrane protein insertion porin family
MSDWVKKMFKKDVWRAVRQGRVSQATVIRQILAVMLLFMASFLTPDSAEAQTYRFTSLSIEGNQRVASETIITYAGIARGETVSAGQLNDAYQRILESGLFETVEVVPQGSRLLIRVEEFPTISTIAFEGNKKIKDEDLAGIVESRSRQVFSPSRAERDAVEISKAYAQNGRVAARVTPKIIRRNDNRVDLVFEIFEGRGIEIQRVSFVGNKVYSDRRLRRVIDSKQAGLLRAIIARDTFVEDRLAFDQQVLTDFYLSRGYVDFRVTGTNAELARERDAYFVTFNIQEGQQFRFGNITTVSELPEANAEDYQAALRIKPGVVYSPTLVEDAIAKMERLGISNGVDFMRVEPRITRNDRDLTLDVEFLLVRGPRIFVERIDIEGNTTTLDRVIRRQFDVVEGDPFNPRQIRETAERIRALGYFSQADVNAREGSRPDQVIVDVDVQETTTGSLTFGGSFSSDAGLGITLGLRERNFLGRGQQIGANFSISSDTANYVFSFVEPSFLGRDVAFTFNTSLVETNSNNSLFDTTTATFRPGLSFPLSDRSRFSIYYSATYSEMDNYIGVSPTLAAEVARGSEVASALGFGFRFDTRDIGLNPNAGVLVETDLEFAGIGGDQEYVKATARVVGERKVFNEDVTLRGVLEYGAIDFDQNFGSRSVDRFTQKIMRGFDPNSMGPVQNGEFLGGNLFAAAKFEAEFPLGLPTEFGITGGAFYDIGSIWNVDTIGAAQSVGFKPRHVVGLSLFWESPFGPIRMDFSRALQKEPFDVERNFDFSVRTDF